MFSHATPQNINTPNITSPLSTGGKLTDNGKVNLDLIYSPNAILIDASTGTILADRNSNQRIYPASLTKMMTAILAFEKLPNLNQTITLQPNYFIDLFGEDASMAGFQPGEKVKAKDLVYGILLPSGAECCKAIETAVAGSESAFVNMMNAKAKQLGMKNTNFSNSTGLHNKNHYSTTSDMAILLQYALKNDNFRTAITTSRYSTQPTNLNPNGITFYSTVFKDTGITELQNGKILGGKTGYTDQAGLCLASLATINGKEYILVTAGANGSPQTDPFHILDAVNVFNQIKNI